MSKRETVYDIIADVREDAKFTQEYDYLHRLAHRLEEAMEIDQDYRRVHVGTLGDWLKAALSAVSTDPDYDALNAMAKEIREARK